MIEEKVTHSFIVEDEEQEEFKCQHQDNDLSLAWHDALKSEDDTRLSSSCNHAFLQSNACICKHARWEHDTCESSLHSDDERNDSIRSFDQYNLSCISII